MVNPSGELIACLGKARQVVAIDSPGGEPVVLANNYNDVQQNSPKNLWIDPKGDIYFSDPRYGKRDDLEQDGEHVYYIPPENGAPIRVIEALTSGRLNCHIPPPTSPFYRKIPSPFLSPYDPRFIGSHFRKHGIHFTELN